MEKLKVMLISYRQHHLKYSQIEVTKKLTPKIQKYPSKNLWFTILQYVPSFYFQHGPDSAISNTRVDLFLIHIGSKALMSLKKLNSKCQGIKGTESLFTEAG